MNIFRVLRRPHILMPLFTGLVIFGWTQVASPTQGVAYDTIDVSENLLTNASFEQWGPTSPEGWSIEASDDLEAQAEEVVGSIDGSGLQIDVSEYSSGSVTVRSPEVAVSSNQAYFFKAFYETDSIVDLLVQELDEDENASYTHLRHYPDYDYPLSSMSSPIEPKETTTKIRMLIIMHDEGYLNLDSSYLRGLDREPVRAPEGIASLPLNSWDFQKGAAVVGSGVKTGSVYRTEISKPNGGQAGWVSNPAGVNEHELLSYTFAYRSDQKVDVGYDYIDENGQERYEFVETLSPTAHFTQRTITIEAPSGAVSISPSIQLDSAGSLEVRDQVLTKLKEAATYDRPRISITFDDGWASSWENAGPVLEENNFFATYYINPGTTDRELFMTREQVEEVLDAGHQVASHTQTHIDITSYLGTFVARELDEAIADLKDYGIHTIDFASPYGKFDQSVLPLIADRHTTHRGTEAGINTKQQTDYYNLKALFIRKEVTAADLRQYIESAQKSNGWLILIYHQIEPLDTPFAIGQERFEKQMQIVKESGIDVMTVRKAAEQLEAQ